MQGGRASLAGWGLATEGGQTRWGWRGLVREERGSFELERRLKGGQVGQMMGRDSPGSAGKPSRLKLKVLSKNPMLKVLSEHCSRCWCFEDARQGMVRGRRAKRKIMTQI